MVIVLNCVGYLENNTFYLKKKFMLILNNFKKVYEITFQRCEISNISINSLLIFKY